jgi:hypothetical protein
MLLSPNSPIAWVDFAHFASGPDVKDCVVNPRILTTFGTLLGLTSSPRRVDFRSSQRAYTSRPYQAISSTAVAAFCDVLDGKGASSTRNTHPCSATHHTPTVSLPYRNNHIFFSSCPPRSSTPMSTKSTAWNYSGARGRLWLTMSFCTDQLYFERKAQLLITGCARLV